MSCEGNGEFPSPPGRRTPGRRPRSGSAWSRVAVTGFCTGAHCCDSQFPVRHEGSEGEELVEQRAIRILPPARKLVARTKTNSPSLRPECRSDVDRGARSARQGSTAMQPPAPSLAQSGAAPAADGPCTVGAVAELTAVSVATDQDHADGDREDPPAGTDAGGGSRCFPLEPPSTDRRPPPHLPHAPPAWDAITGGARTMARTRSTHRQPPGSSGPYTDPVAASSSSAHWYLLGPVAGS